MRWISTAAQVRALDRRLIEGVGVPGVALMELAARGVADAILAHHRRAAARGTVIVCGSGNNGGDGWGIARWLHQRAIPVRIWPLAEPRTDDAAIMAEAARRLRIPEVGGLQGASLLVDAVFGTGLTRVVEGALAGALAAMDAHPAPVVAVDLPSGLHADRGSVLGSCPAAVRTVTLGRLKPGLFTEPGASLAGVVQLVDIGLAAAATAAAAADDAADAAAELPGALDLAPLWPTRPVSAHKGRSGHLLVVAGSLAMAGAASLVCQGALAAGVGLVSLAAPRGALVRLASLPPEVMVLPVDGGAGDGFGERLQRLPELRRFDALAVGPGLGGGAALAGPLAEQLARLWREHRGPVVFDADALEATSELGGAGPPRVLTPHPGEAGRLLGWGTQRVSSDRFAAVEALAARGTALLKGRHTLVASGGRRISVNATGAPTLATAGSGDVLTGVVGALLARGVAPHDAARLAAWVHGAAGERLASTRRGGWRASDVAAALPDAIEALSSSGLP